jgi:hypothetical protein
MTTPPPEPPDDSGSSSDVPAPQPSDPFAAPSTPPPPSEPYGTPSTPPPPSEPYGTPSTPPPPPPGEPYGQPGYGQPGYGQPGYGYGQPAFAGGGAAYGQQPPGLGDALTYGWERFKANAGPIMTAVVVYVVGAIVVFGILYATIIAAARGGDAGFFGALVGFAVMTIAFTLLAFLVQAALIRGALAITRGERPTSAHFFTVEHLGPVVVASLLIALASGIGTILCYIPGLIVQYLTQYALFYVIDKNMGAVDAIRASVQLTLKYPGVLIVFAIVSAIILTVAAVLCFLPLLVAFPVVLIAQADLYKRLQDEPVV